MITTRKLNKYSDFFKISFVISMRS